MESAMCRVGARCDPFTTSPAAYEAANGILRAHPRQIDIEQHEREQIARSAGGRSWFISFGPARLRAGFHRVRIHPALQYLA